jgi:enoyl-CoA hydratase
LATSAAQTAEFLRVERDGGIAIVTMDRPPVNAVSQQMYGEIRDLFGRADELLEGVSVVVLRAEGRHFCAGNDLREFESLNSANSPGRMRLVRDAFSAIYDCPVPVIAAVQGVAAGTGVAIAASCDLVVCAESATFTTPEVNVGVMGGARHLRRLVPEQTMRAMYFTADPVPAAELERFGGIAEVVPDERLLEATLDLAARVARHSRAALRHAKEALNTVETMGLKDGYEAEQRLTARLAAHPDSLEARRAVLEGRPPEYSNE